MSRDEILSCRDALKELREILFANVVMAGEIPSPTGREGRLTRFLSDRFTESGLDNISEDEAGNVAGILSGKVGSRNILVAAHLDKIWSESDDHTVSVGVGEMSGRGLADNGLGVAALASLPLVLRALEIELDSNLILLGTSRSFGRGDLRGMRFFLENSDRPIASALCIEGIDLGRLSYSSLGMARGEITVDLQGVSESPDEDAAGGIAKLAQCAAALIEINRRECPETGIRIGAIAAGSGFSVPPRTGSLRFEIRSEDASRVAAVEAEIVALIDDLSDGGSAGLEVEIIARRKPGNLGAKHPLVTSAGKVLESLGIETHEKPSVSELAALLDKNIPALTLGITKGEHRHSPRETIRLEPIFDGLAQVVAMVQYMDGEEFSF